MSEGTYHRTHHPLTSTALHRNLRLFTCGSAVPVVVAGVGFGLGPSLCSAVLGALAYNFFLTEPRYTLLVDDPANIWAIALLFVIGLIVSSVAYTSRRRAADAALLWSQETVLQNYSRAVVTARQYGGDRLHNYRSSCSPFPSSRRRHARLGGEKWFPSTQWGR
ncbi:DUF4118 domain-containing protein [Ensifer sp. IC3342]|nr:DUF4118 domain-containing protein [Ensifer sp. BRP08]MCA1451389.1 DUF4118 domain-containing protein [Ensifer sp. IC3342]